MATQLRPPPSHPDFRDEGPSQGRGGDSWQRLWGPCQLPHPHTHPGPQTGLCACVCEQSLGPEDTVKWALITAGWDSPPTRHSTCISLVIRTSDNPPTSKRELLFLSPGIDGTDIKAAKDRWTPPVNAPSRKINARVLGGHLGESRHLALSKHFLKGPCHAVIQIRHGTRVCVSMNVCACVCLTSQLSDRGQCVSLHSLRTHGHAGPRGLRAVPTSACGHWPRSGR